MKSQEQIADFWRRRQQQGSIRVDEGKLSQKKGLPVGRERRQLVGFGGSPAVVYMGRPRRQRPSRRRGVGNVATRTLLA
jgi:hypothetical protein